MRQKTRSTAQTSRSSTKEPLAEGLQVEVPLDSRGRRMWSKMSDEEIIRFAQKTMTERKITGRNDLQKADPPLYAVLLKRGLLGEVGFKEKVRSWKGMSDEEIVEHAVKFIEKEEVEGKKELCKADPGLYDVLRKRGLLDEIGLETKRRSWKEMNDEEIVEFARKVMKERRITRKNEMEREDSGLYEVLRTSRLLDKVGFEEKSRSWKGMSDEEIVEFTRHIIKEKYIDTRSKLQRAYPGLFFVLKRRGLLDQVGFVDKRRRQRSWKGMSDEEIVEFASQVIQEKAITKACELDEADSGLYSILRRRKLIDSVFAYLEKQRDDRARDAVMDALESFAANDNNSAEDDVA